MQYITVHASWPRTCTIYITVHASSTYTVDTNRNTINAICSYPIINFPGQFYQTYIHIISTYQGLAKLINLFYFSCWGGQRRGKLTIYTLHYKMCGVYHIYGSHSAINQLAFKKKKKKGFFISGEISHSQKRFSSFGKLPSFQWACPSKGSLPSPFSFSNCFFIL